LDPELIRLPLADGAIEVSLLDLGRLDGLESMAERFLTAPERGEYEELRIPERRREWLGARVGLKLMAVRGRAVDDPLRCAVVKDPSGRPRLVEAPGFAASVLADCSLSHKGRFACVATSGTPGLRIGVDIEEVSPRLQRLADAFAHERDRVTSSRTEPERLAILWALKEACSKVLGRGLAMGFREVTCEETSPGHHRVAIAGVELAGRHTIHEGHAVALCFGSGQELEG
jgi:phosphopantetheinyl transferase